MTRVQVKFNIPYTGNNCWLCPFLGPLARIRIMGRAARSGSALLLLLAALGGSRVAEAVRTNSGSVADPKRQIQYEEDDTVYAVSGMYDTRQQQALRKKAEVLIDLLEGGEPSLVLPAAAKDKAEPAAPHATWEEDEFSVSGAKTRSGGSKKPIVSLLASSPAVASRPSSMLSRQSAWAARETGQEEQDPVFAVSGTMDDVSTNPRKKARLMALPQFASWAEEEQRLDRQMGQMVSQEIFVNPRWAADDVAQQKSNQTNNNQRYTYYPSASFDSSEERRNQMLALLNTGLTAAGGPVPVTKAPQILGGKTPTGDEVVEELLPQHNPLPFSWVTCLSFAIGLFLPCSLVCCGIAKMPDPPTGLPLSGSHRSTPRAL